MTSAMRPIRFALSGLRGAARRAAALACLALAAAVAALALAASPALASGFPILGSFEGSTLDNGWSMPSSETIGGSGGSTLSNDASLTGTNSIPGWLQLTAATTSQVGWVYNTTPFPSSAGVLVSFDYADYGGTGADGLTFFLFGSNSGDPDGSTPLSLTTGPTGGSLGYADCPGSHQDGLTNAYVGIGFDEFGNFSNTSFACDLDGGYGPGLNPNRLVVRGPGSAQTGYPYETSALITDPGNASEHLTGSGITDYRHVTILITPTGLLSVYVTFPDGNTQTVTSGYQLPADPPTYLQLGFVASTGGSTDYHDIRADSVTEPADIQTRVASSTANADRGATITDTFTVTNAGPNPSATTTIGASSLSSTLSNVSWTCTNTVGTPCNQTSGTGLPSDTIDMNDGDEATYTITATDNSTSDPQASVQLTATPTGATGQSVPGDNVATANTQLPPYATSAPSFTLVDGVSNYTGVATVTPGTYVGNGVTVTDQWQRCTPSGSSCANISGATGTTYDTTTADRGSTLRIAETASNSAGSAGPVYTAVFSPLPITTLTTSTPADTNQTSASFTLGTSNYLASQVSYECDLDGGGWTSCSSTPTFSSLSNGSHTLQARSVFAGLSDPNPQSFSWSVNTVAPSAPVVSTPANGSYTNNTEPPITGTAQANSTVTVYIDGVDVGTTTASGTGAWSYTPTTPLSNATHTVKATATDAYGNTSAASNTNSFTVDTVPPAAPVVGAPANGSTTNSDEPTITGTAEADSTVTVYIDGVAVGTTTANASGVWSYTPTSPLANGAHTVKATATDLAGNTGPASNTNTFTVAEPPAAPVQSGPARGSTTTDTTPTISGTAPPNSTVTIYVDGAPVATTTTDSSGNWSVTLTSPLSDGPHTVTETATDQSGAVSATSSPTTFTVDPIPAPPTITGAPVGLTSVGQGTFTFSPPSVGGVEQCQLDDYSWHTCDESLTLVNLPPGTYTLSVRQVDGSGNASATTTLQFTVTKGAPENAALACTNAQIVLINVVRHGRGVYVSGAARSAWIGKTVAIRFALTGKIVGHTKVRSDGTFFTNVPMPPARYANSNATRYEAVVGRNVSSALKLARRVEMTTVQRRGASVLLSGQVSGSFKRGTAVKIIERVTCTRFKVVAHVRLTRSGSYSAKVAAPTGTAAQLAMYRAQTAVLLRGFSHATYTLPTPIHP